MNNNQSNGKTSQALSGPANGDTSPAKASPQRRYRRSSHSSKSAVMTQAETVVPPTITEPAPVSNGPVPPAPSRATKAGGTKAPGSSNRGGRATQPKTTTKPAAKSKAPIPATESTEPPAAAAAPQPPSTGGAASSRPRTRSQRNGRRNKTPDVHLVASTTAPEPETAETARPLDAGGAATAPEMSPEAFVLPAVPVLTSSGTADHTAREAAPEVAQLEAAPTTTAAAIPSAPPSRRYRFDRRPAGNAAPAQATRPEKLSGSHPLQAPAEAESSPVEPLAPEEPLRLFGPRSATGRSYAEETTGDDILSELGLRDAHHLQEEDEDSQQEPGPADLRAEQAGGTAGSALRRHEDSEAEVDAASSPAHEPLELQDSDSATESDAAGSASARPRRRRRRRASHPAALETPESLESGEFADMELPGPSASDLPAGRRPAGVTSPATRPGTPTSADSGRYTSGYDHGSPPAALPAAQAQSVWDISTAQQHVRQEDSPFGAPAPSFARGFGPQPRGVASAAHEAYTSPAPTRTERRIDTPPMSSNQLANTVSSAIAQQTDRLLTELRRQQTPPSMTVMFPPSVSTERVGIFVDVANLLYSARSLRINIDFGKLLEFLRGNRRLIRAHAYAPTNPDPGADQSFLAAVKGMGYRITTKNYKTFSSGAKKADMDLDLCMDIVRMVDAGALDTVVLVSGDSDFLPLLEYCSDRGVRVEAAAFDDSAAMILRQSCDLFINLTLAPDIRADNK